MNTSNNISFYNKLLLFFIYLNSATILVPDKFKAWPIGILALIIIVRHFKLKTKPVLEIKKLLISIGFFLILVLSTAYSSDISYALKKLETGSSLVVFPLLFYITAGDRNIFSDNTIRTLKLTFIISLVLFLISTFTYFYFTEPFFSFKNTLEHYTNLVDIRISKYSTHPIYLSIYIGIAIIFSFTLFKENKPKTKYFIFFALPLLIAFTAILNKKGPIISLAVIGLFFIIKNKFNFKKIVYITPLFTLLVGLIVFIPRYENENKFEELLEIGNNKNSSSGLRLQIYGCALQKIAKAPICGYGWGDVKTALRNCYAGKNSEELLKNNYNSHNQYLSILLSIGILGFIAFVYYLFYIFKVSRQRNSQLLFFLTLYFCLNMLTENILEREDGVIVIAFFLNLFLFSINKKNETIKQ